LKNDKCLLEIMTPHDDHHKIIEPDNALPEVTLKDLPEIYTKTAANAGWPGLMPVQAKTIPYMRTGRDLMVQSRTGSGKTGAFLMPIIERLKPAHRGCQALILVPTRELAVQVSREAETLARDSGIRTIAVYGGVGYGPQMNAFRDGAQLVIGTPGRILDHLIKRTLVLSDLEILVFDEADRMMSMGFYPDMKKIQSFLPNKRIHGFMFSATFPPYVMRLSRQFLHEPELLSLSRDQVHVASTLHVFYEVPGMEKDRSLVKIIEIENPTSAFIFCNTKAQVHFVNTVLERFGYDADELSADLSQSARERVLTRVRKGTLRFLVATDLAARGIDIPDLSHVIHYEPPEDPESYVHRAGRTGRAGAMGESISLVSGMERLDLQRIANRFHIDLIERTAPTDEEVQGIVSERVIALLESRLRDRDKLKVERMERFIPLVEHLSKSEDPIRLIAMLIDDYYQESLHAPVAGVEEPDEIVREEPRSNPSGPRSEDKRPRRRSNKDRPSRR
jgi:ATP-dependent RNA helicase DeaD